MLDDAKCCDRHAAAWGAFMAKLKHTPMHTLTKETRVPRILDKSDTAKRNRDNAEADRLIREYQHRHELNKVSELERIAAIERRKVAARVTDEQTQKALEILERKTA